MKIRVYITFFISVLFLLISFNRVLAQENEGTLYLVFEFMKVDNDQETAYQETETFWKKIHQARVDNGEILGWDLWSLQPGGENQGYQYLTVTLFDDPVKMMGDQPIFEAAQRAYPDLSEEELNMRFEETAQSRDLAVRIYLEQIAITEGDFEMNVGMVASLDLMKVDMDAFEVYENAEMEIFQPLHQEQVDAGDKGSWELLRVVHPYGSEVYFTHLTANMFEGWDQIFSGSAGETPSFANEMMIQKGLETREMKWTYWATLREMVR